jgi:hypothetical protein
LFNSNLRWDYMTNDIFNDNNKNEL